MSIRFTITDRATGAIVTVPAPKSVEYVKDGKRHTKARQADCDDTLAVIKGYSKLGMRGGCLA